ncbi:MAG: hypothetical protein U0670_17655 [Anaerolineae bacterium]
MDVVDGDPALFDTRIDGDLVRGRGVFDMKFAPALYIEVLRSAGSIARRSAEYRVDGCGR